MEDSSPGLTHPKRLLAVLAHPDDECLGFGGTICKYAHEGVETYLVTATRGERGRFGNAKESPGLHIVGATRERELREAASILGLKEVNFLDYCDGDLDKADPREAIQKIAGHIRRISPQVVMTFGFEGGYGHPDHIAIAQFTTAAIVVAADARVVIDSLAAHRVSKLYYVAWPLSKWNAYQSALKELSSTVDGVKRIATPYPDWAITTRLNARKYWKTVWQAITCHETQMSVYDKLGALPEAQHEVLWGEQEFYRVFSTVNGGRHPETDLFEGL